MADYQKMYAILCGAVDDVIGELEQLPIAGHAVQQLQEAMQRAEVVYMNSSLYVDTGRSTKLLQLKMDKSEREV